MSTQILNCIKSIYLDPTKANKHELLYTHKYTQIHVCRRLRLQVRDQYGALYNPSVDFICREESNHWQKFAPTPFFVVVLLINSVYQR